MLTPRPAPPSRRPRAVARRLAALTALAAVGVPASAVGLTAPAVAADPLPYRATPVPDRVVMSPTSAPERSQTFGWRTDGDTATGRAEAQRLADGVPVGPVIAADATTADRRTVGHEGGSDYAVRHHRAKLQGLEPGTAYRYRVGSDAGWSPWRAFTTAGPGGIATPPRRGPALRWTGTRTVACGGALRLRLALGQPGRLTVTATDDRRPSRRVAATVRRTVARSGARTVVVRPTAAARAVLRRGDTVAARVTVRFVPDAGRAVTVRRVVRLRPR